MGTTGAQLEKWCIDNGVEYWGGVHCASSLPGECRPYNLTLIINHSPCSGEGTHWVACQIRGTRAYWFDSFGQPPDSHLEDALLGPTRNFQDWLSSIGIDPGNVTYNATDLQSTGSDVCGLYACYFCKHGLPSLNPRAWRFLSPDYTKHNDLEIQKRVKIPLLPE